jgi:hypothetical protein
MFCVGILCKDVADLSRPAHLDNPDLDFVSKFCHMRVPSKLPPNDYIGGMRKPMRRTGTHIVALSASAARPGYRSSERGCACVTSVGSLSQQNQPGPGLRKPD